MSSKLTIEEILKELLNGRKLEELSEDELNQIEKTLDREFPDRKKRKVDSVSPNENRISEYKKAVQNSQINTSKLSIIASGKRKDELLFAYDKDGLNQLFFQTSTQNIKKEKTPGGSKQVVVKKLINSELALAIRELLNSFEQQGITDERVPGLSKFRDNFNKIVAPSLPPERILNQVGTEIISDFKNKVLTKEEAVELLKKLKVARLTTPISELFDFVLYLKDSSHKSIKELDIRDDEDRLSYNYYTSHRNSERLYLDYIMFGNIGLAWGDNCADETKLKISDCLKLQNTRDGLEDEFDKHKSKDARIFACYSISQNPYLSEKIAADVLSITDTVFEFFPYPKDYQAIIETIHTNIYKKFSKISKSNPEKREKLDFEMDFERFKDLDSAIWYKGIGLTSNEYSSEKTTMAKKLSESTNDYREYLKQKSEWLWSIADIIDTFDGCDISITKSQIIDYAIYVLAELKNDEIINHLHQKLIDDKKHEKLLFKDYDFDILAGLLSTVSNVHTIIRRVLVSITDNPTGKKLFDDYCYWLDFVNTLNGKNSEEGIASLIKFESHPDNSQIWYSFHEIWTSIRFWLYGFEVNHKRLLQLAKDGWNREKYYKNIKHSDSDDDNVAMSLFTYLTIVCCFGSESEKNDAVEEIKPRPSNIIKSVAKHIKDELKSFGSLKPEYKKVLEELKGVCNEK